MYSISEVVGKNAKRIRSNNSMESVATAARSLGLTWSAGSVSAIERGNHSCTIESLISLASVLSFVTKQPVSCQDLLKSEHPISLSPKLSAESKEVWDWLTHEPPQIDSYELPTPGEQRIAEKAGITCQELRKKSIAAWGMPIEEKRDQMAGDEATAQKRGRITRKLINELEL